MLKVLRKLKIPIQNLSISEEVLKSQISPRFIKTVLSFDGSMTNFVANLNRNQKAKPIIKIIQEKQVSLNSLQNLKQQQTLFDLKKVFNTYQDQKQKYLIQRSIKFFVNELGDTKQEQLLYFARSFWKKQKYEKLMQKNKYKPIGLNLIEQEVQVFRKLNWTGIADLQIGEQRQQSRCFFKNLPSRSYSMINKGQPLCELQEFFLPSTFDLFKN